MSSRRMVKIKRIYKGRRRKMTDEEKARALASKYARRSRSNELSKEAVRQGAMEMAEWKEKQHSIAYVVTRCEEHSDYVEEVFFDIEKAKQCCAKYNSNEDNYRRHITKVNVTL